VIAALLVSTSVLVDEVNAPPRESVAAVPLAQPAPLHSLAAEPGAPGPGGDPARRTLVLYNDTGASAAISHSDAIQAANLASRGGSWTMRPVERYTAGDLRGYQSAIYVARYSQTPLPAAFLRDVARDNVPVLWMGDNIEQLFTAEPATTARYGWRPVGPDETDVPTVEYAGQQLLRRTGAQEQLNRVELAPKSRAETLGTARHADGSGYPWAVRSRNLTYIGEVPFSYVDTRDRYLAAADIIGRLVAPDAPDRKRALIRIEDVGPNTDPAQIRAIADLLSARGVPFSLATYPYYRDPKGAAHDGVPTSFRLVDVPDVVEALKYAQDRGATIIMHGYSHQHADAANPYDGVSAGDFEFYTAHVDEQNAVRLDAPVPEDSRQWASDRLAVGRAEFTRVGLADPGIFEFPHYAGSAVDYQAVHDMFGVRYDQGTYFSGQCPQGRCSTTEDPGSAGLSSQYFPYPVRDVYGSVVVPENLGNISDAYNNNAARTAQDVVDAAGAMTVVRDGVASTFFHPFLPLSELQAVVDGIQADGFRFVSPSDIVHDTGQPGR
jgi:uncharacterized protein YdaL